MQTGGTQADRQITRTIRYAGLIFPLLLIGYGSLYAIGVLQGRNFEGTLSFLLLSSGWLIIAFWQFFARPKDTFTAALRLGFYHIFSALYLLMVAGASTSFVIFWVLLLVASHFYFKYRGLMVSIGTFMAITLIELIRWGSIDSATIPYALGSLVAVLVSGLIIVSLAHAQSIDQDELERSHLQENLQRDRITTIVNNLADAVLSTDKDGIIRVYNSASLSLLDTNSSLNGNHIDTTLRLVDLEGEPVVISSLLKNITSVEVRDDVYHEFEDGQRLRLEITTSPIRKAFENKSDGRDGYVLIIRDVTKAKSLEEERDEFISVVSHELRTPVTVVEGSLSNIEVMLGKANIPKERLTDAVGAAREQTVYLAKMINDLGTLSRAERGASDDPERIVVRDLAQSLFHIYSPHAQRKGLHLNLDVTAKSVAVYVSRLYLEELLQNLITNAIKYTKEGSVTLSIQKSGDLVTFAVKDTGIGISKTDQARIFGKFYRSEDYRTRETSGTGLGLYVATKLARKLETEVSLISRLNHGSTFSFELPVHDSTDNK